MTENQLLERILELCNWLCLLTYHTHDSRRSQAGFPDLVIVGRRGLIWAELKSATGQLSERQVCWRSALHEAGQDWYLWRPADWESGEIAEVLRRLAG